MIADCDGSVDCNRSADSGGVGIKINAGSAGSSCANEAGSVGCATDAGSALSDEIEVDVVGFGGTSSGSGADDGIAERVLDEVDGL